MKDMHMCCLIVDHTPGSPNPQNLQKCDCVLLAITEEDTVDLTDALTKSPQNIDSVWIDNPLYILHESDRNRISRKSDNGWLDDNIISASQKLLVQTAATHPGTDEGWIHRTLQA